MRGVGGDDVSFGALRASIAILAFVIALVLPKQSNGMESS